MANQVILPRLGQGMESGTIVRWLKAEGDAVEKGESLYELDTEKVTQEVEADASGTLLKILVREGEVPVGKAVAVIGEEGEEVIDEAEDPSRATEDEPAEEGEPAPEREDERERGRDASTGDDGNDQPTQIKEPPQRDGGRIKASPLARRLAQERGIELSSVQGTGPEGRIVAEDVERLAAGAPTAPSGGAAAPAPAGEVEVEKLSQMRRTIARRLTEAWETPHFQIAMSADMSAAIRLREKLVERAGEDEPRPTFSDILTKACAVALMRHRALNAHFAGEEIRIFPSANIGIAVAIPNGLVVPVIRSAERLTVPEIAAARADLVARTRENKLRNEDLEDGTFTISNLGMYGVDRFVAVLNPPQAAILAVGAIQERAVVAGGEIVARPLMELTLSCDHRSVDGATASAFLGDVKAFLEEPGLAL
jgi:pyruvate dehydrogenase E2 component (dihydrolipoamide acetyltransferase)